MLVLTQRHPANRTTQTALVLALTAEERTRSRHHFTTEDGHSFYVQLPRGTVLQDGDLLQAESGEWVRVSARPEPVMTVTTEHPLDLLRAAYHLGNRHVSLEVTPHYLRLSPDSVLKSMLQQMGLSVVEETQPFHPETGAYGHSHRHAHAH
ncbi:MULTISPECIES: urease accessory protein UreE [unclassified Leptolyngbya]|uniref:urease accessory protein UreE n=1 Tax=unclassified Leptolyngbya TaxID=2650499 RepID=UPI00168892C5|nr:MULTISPECIES: urease accessory protein UreE [unclassified Leptolyngbya]MBD1913018.1 urease accessory protein UreE [Leptolyngbya sp. FACHB-8]MBD2154481.1 urease accessory protein UreE [Leptolyngbya sp. FACHB-16]